MVWKIQTDVVFPISEEISFRKCKQTIFKTLLILSIPKHASKRSHAKLQKFLSSKFPLRKTLERSWNLDRITVTKIVKCFRINGCRKWRNRFKIEKSIVLADYMEQQIDYSRYRLKISKSKRNSSLRNQSYLPTLIKQLETISRTYQQLAT